MGTTKTTTKGGNLRIGDQWNAITIIASSQTYSLKAVCELVENAIDAHAGEVHLVRRKKRGKTFLEVWDDGKGVTWDEDGEPDFNRIATHVCDSMKRHLDGKDRDGVHGEFGIGLLSFWSLGEELQISSAGRDGRLHEMALKRGERSYSVRTVRGELPIGGTRVVIGPLLATTRSIVTGEKLQRYLATELRDRIRNTGVRIRITDRVSRKNLVVVPREFDGDPLDVPSRLTTPHGHLTVEIYPRPGGGGHDGGIAVCKDGTRVLRNLTDVDAFQHAPWDDGRLEGVVDYPALNLAPGTRSGIVPDEYLQAFITAVTALEQPLQAALEQWDQAELDKASRQILKQVHRAFINALRELPSNEYLFFDIPQLHPARQGNAPTGGNSRLVPAVSRVAEVDEDAVAEEPVLFPVEPGPLATVHIRPQTARRVVGEECPLSTTAKDAQGLAIPDGVEFRWEMCDGQASLDQIDGPRCRVTSQQVGAVIVRVTAVQGEHQAAAECTVKFLENVSADDRESGKGLPSYRLEADRGAHWRSRYDAPANEIVINSAHRDFLASKQTGAKHRRYIGKLYAKEVVLINFAHESPAEVMERLIEVLVRTEDTL